MSQFIKFYFTSSMLNMFRTFILKLCFSLPHGYHPNPATPKLQHIESRTHNQCGDRIEKSQAPDDGCINVRNLLSIEEAK